MMGGMRSRLCERAVLSNIRNNCAMVETDKRV